MVNNKEALYLVGGLVAGIVIGTLATRTYFKDAFERIANEEIESVKERYRYVRKEGMEPPEDTRRYVGMVENLYQFPIQDSGVAKKELFQNYIPQIPADYAPQAPQSDGKTFVLDADYKEVMDPHPPEFEDYARDRDMSKPYLISVEEFMNDEQGYDKISLDYYKEDDVVADQSDRPYEDQVEVLGTEWDTKFGFGSDDKNVVYVRNDQLEIDFEISLDERAYTEVALGIKAPREQIGKFREDD